MERRWGARIIMESSFCLELARTVKMVNPAAFLIAEDHTGWSAMTQSLDQGGVGFDAVLVRRFLSSFNRRRQLRRQLRESAEEFRLRHDAPLKHGLLHRRGCWPTQYKKSSITKNHDEAGNDANTERTIVTAVELCAADWRYADVCRGAQPWVSWPVGAIGRNANVFDGRRNWRGEIFHIRRFLLE